MAQFGGQIMGFAGGELPPIAASIQIEILFGADFPTYRDGKRGDLYIDTQTRYLYKKTTQRDWEFRGVLSSRILTGAGVPSSGAGNDGDLYFRANGEIYSRAGGAWSLVANVTGPTGPTGPTGAVSAASALVLEETAIAPSTGVGEVQLYNLNNELRWRGESDGAERIAAATNTPQTYSAAQVVQTVVLTDAATINTDASLSNVFRVVLGGNRNLANPTNLVDGATYLWMVKQDGTGGRSLTFGSAFIWMGGNTPPTLSTAPNAVDLISCVSDGTNLYCNFTGA